MNDAVLVTGAGGFVGSAVVRLLVRSQKERGVTFPDGTPVGQIVALIRPGGSRERLQEVSEFGGWSIEYADFTDRSQLHNAIRRISPRTIIHLGMDGSIQRDLPEAERHRVNIGPLETLFEGLAAVPNARLIHTGSAWVLQGGEKLAEDAPLQRRSVFTENKARLDDALPVLGAKTRVKWINLRLFNIFGKYESASRLLPHLVSSLTQGQVAELSDGDQIRDFNDVEIIAHAYLQALQAEDSACNQLYHIGSGRGTRVRDFALAVARVTGNTHLIHFGRRRTQDQSLRSLVADPSRARRLLHWSPATDLEARIRSAVEWWLERTVPLEGLR